MAAKKKPGQQQQNQQNDDDDDDDAGGGLTDEMRTEITNLVNAAVSGQLSRKLPNAIAGALGEGLKPLQEQLAALGGNRRGNDDGGDDDDDDEQQQQQQRGKTKGKAARSRDPEVEQMRKRMQQLEDERRQEKESARNRERDSLLREQLEAAGVDKNRIRGAIAVLRDSMKYDDKAGEWVYKAKRDGGYEDDLDVSAGVSEWADTDEGKSYLAPPQGQQQQRAGSGVRPSGAGGAPKLGAGGGRPVPDKGQAKAQAKQEAMTNLTKAIDSLGGGVVGIG